MHLSIYTYIDIHTNQALFVCRILRYGVPGESAAQFEAAMVAAVPELLAHEAGLLYKMTTMLPPRTLAEAGVPVCRLLQRPGSFVVTWPRAYHAVYIYVIIHTYIYIYIYIYI